MSAARKMNPNIISDDVIGFVEKKTTKMREEGFVLVAVHVYCREDGEPIYWKVRLKHPDKPKWIRALSHNADGIFQMKEPDFASVYPDGNGKKPLYRLPDIVTAAPDAVVYIVEGEQKADALAALGLVATTSGGSNSTDTTHWQPLAGRRVRIWPDHDTAGQSYAREVTAALLALGCNVEVIDTDALNLEAKGDAVDWLAAHPKATAADVLALAVRTEVRSETAANDATSADNELRDAIQTVNAAIEATSTDPGALFESEATSALMFIYSTSKSEYARLRQAIKQMRVVSLSELELLVKPKSDGGGREPGITDLLVSIAKEQCQFFHNADLEPYATFERNNHRECWHLQSKGFSEWLSYQLYQTEGYAPSDVMLKSAIASLSGQAKFEGEEKPVHVRTARHDNAYWLDLCNEHWQAVRITADGWQVIDNPPVMFTRSSSSRPLPIPRQGGDFAALWDFVNIPEADQLTVLAWLLECLRPDTPYLVLELTGEQGSAKSSTQEILRDLIDPNLANCRAAPKAIEDVWVMARNSLMVSFENLSHLSPAYQDALCVLATGGGFATRTLFTTSDETVLNLKKPVVLNGIAVIVTAQDLLDRTIHIDLPTITRRVRASELRAGFEKKWAEIFGGLLHEFAAALKVLPSIELAPEQSPRMVDFAFLGEAVCRAHGLADLSFVKAYDLRRKEGIHRTIEASPVAVAMLEYLEAIPSGFEGTVKGLLAELSRFRPEGEAWPKSPRGFGDIVRRLAPALRMIGVNVRIDDKPGMHGYGCILKRQSASAGYTAHGRADRPNHVHDVHEVHGDDQKPRKTGGRHEHDELHEHGFRDRMPEKEYDPAEGVEI